MIAGTCFEDKSLCDWMRLSVHPVEGCGETGAQLIIREYGGTWGPSVGRYGYTAGLRELGGALLWFYVDDAERRYATLDLSGDALGRIGVGRVLAVARRLRSAGHVVKCRRCDLAADTHRITPLEVFERFYSDIGVRCAAQRVSLRRIDEPLAVREDGVVGVQGVTLGKRCSERYLRVYNKHGATRIELEFKGKWAERVFDSMLETADDFSIGGLIRDFVDFDGWAAWASALGDAARVALRVYGEIAAAAVDVVRRKSAWVDRQVLRTLGVLGVVAQAEGRSLGEDLQLAGRAALRRVDYALIEAYFEGTAAVRVAAAAAA